MAPNGDGPGPRRSRARAVRPMAPLQDPAVSLRVVGGRGVLLQAGAGSLMALTWMVSNPSTSSGLRGPGPM